MAIAEVKDRVLSNAVIDMDNIRFFGCKFTNCTLRYKGGQCEWDRNTTFVGCHWDFLDAAKRTVDVIQATGGSSVFSWASNHFSTLG